MTRQHDDVELASALRQQLGDRAHVRMEQHLDAALLQRAHVRLAGARGCRRRTSPCNRSDVSDLEHRLHAQRSGILVGRQHAGVDDQHAALRPSIALELGAHAVRLMRRERGRPFRGERRLVDRLVALDALRTGRFPTFGPRSARSSRAAGRRPCARRRARRTRDRCPRNTRARSAYRSRRARRRAPRGTARHAPEQ